MECSSFLEHLHILSWPKLISSKCASMIADQTINVDKIQFMECSSFIEHLHILSWPKLIYSEFSCEVARYNPPILLCMVCGQDALANASWPHTKQCFVCLAMQCNAMHSISWNDFVFYTSSTCWARLRSKIGGWCLDKMHWPMHLGHKPCNA